MATKASPGQSPRPDEVVERPPISSAACKAAGVRFRSSSGVPASRHRAPRLVPLDLHLPGASPAAARAAVLDYGQVLRDLAAANIFPGDLLLKNFGVSRHGRVIFYDYDELSLLTDRRFRDLPSPSTTEEEVASEPWYFVGEHDVFPEEFRSFLGLRDGRLEAFLETHRELLTPDFWRRMQGRHRRGEVPDIYPYPAIRRLRDGDARRDTP